MSFYSKAAKGPDAASGFARDAWVNFASYRLAVSGCMDVPECYVQNAGAALEQEVQGAHIAIKRMLQQQNNLLPISRLPAELLSHVFQELREDIIVPPPHVQSYRSTPKDYIDKSWLAVTYVCVAWRATAISCASLWTSVPMFMGEQWAHAFVERSKAATLSLKLPGFSSSHSWRNEIMREEMGRIGHLEIVGGSICGADFAEFMGDDVPNELVKFVLHPHEPGILGQEDVELLQQSPKLRYLVIKNVAFSWHALPWDAVRSVTICMPAPSPDSPPADLSILIDALEYTAGLELLHLDTSQCPFISTDSTQPEPVYLPELRFFVFAGSIIDFTHLFSAIDLDDATLDITLHSNNLMTDISLLEYALGALVREHIMYKGFTAMRLSSNKNEIRVELWQSTVHSRHVKDRSDAAVNIALHLKSYDREATNAALAALCKCVNLGYVDELYLPMRSHTLMTTCSVETWHTLFSPENTIERVYLIGPRVHQFFKALHTPTQAATYVGGSTTQPKLYSWSHSLFPFLREVYLSEFDAQRTLRDSREDLVNWIEARALHKPIQFLSITKSSIHEYTIEWFKEVDGLKVVWDGFEGRYQSKGEIDNCRHCDIYGCAHCRSSDSDSSVD